MAREEHSSKLGQGTIRGKGISLEYVACSGTGRGKPDPSRWWISVKIIQLEFDIGELVLDCTRNTIILLPKGGGEYHVIGLVEVLWKVISIIIDRRLEESI